MADGNRIEILDKFTVGENGIGAEFRTEDRYTVKLLDLSSDHVSISWVPHEPLNELTDALSSIAHKSTDVHVMANDRSRDLHVRGRLLAIRLSRLAYLQNVQIVDKIKNTVVSVGIQHDTAGGEIQISAPNWEKAAALAKDLGAANIADNIPELVKRIPAN